MKGSRYVVLKRDLAEFVVHNPISIKLYNWMVDMTVADESFYSTLVTVGIQSDGSVTQDFKKNTTNGQERKKGPVLIPVFLQNWVFYYLETLGVHEEQ